MVYKVYPKSFQMKLGTEWHQYHSQPGLRSHDRRASSSGIQTKELKSCIVLEKQFLYQRRGDEAHTSIESSTLA